MIGPGREALSLVSQGWLATNLIFLVSIGRVAPVRCEPRFSGTAP